MLTVNVVILAYILPLFGILTISLLVFQRRKFAFASYVTFSLTFFSIIIWQLLQLTAYYSSADISLTLYRFSIAVALLSLAFLLLYGVLYPVTQRFPSFVKILVIFLPALVLLPFCFDVDMITSVRRVGEIQDIQTGSLYILHTLVSIGYVVTFLFILLKKRSIYPRQKNAINSLILSISIPLIAGVIFNFILATLVGLHETFYIFPISLFATAAIVAYSIIKHQLFDIKTAAIRSAAYIFALLTLSLIYYALAYLVSFTLFQGETTSDVSISPINILLALMLAFIFQPIKTFFDKTTDKIFFRDHYKSDEFYARLSEVLTTTTDLRNLLQRAALEIGATLKAEQAFFFLQYEDGKRHITAGTKDHKDLPLDDVGSINTYVQSNGDDILVTQLLETDSKLKRVLISHKVALLMPLMHHDRAVGYLALGEQKSSGYTNRDIKVLKTISDELIIAIQNALSVQEVRMINANLEQRIEMATAELRTSNARLKRLDASKDEFLSMASHQLRTPLTSVKGYLSMMIDGDVGKISAIQKQVLEEAFSSSERMVHLIHDFLNVSRLQTGKFMLELSDVDLSELIQQEVKSLEKVASSHSMKLEFTNTAGDVHLQIDDTKIRQVVMNYIDNAIYYSHPDSTINIELSKIDKNVVLEIKDTGIGVPKSEQEQLFSKFYRASNARKQRPDGTGVGIFLAKKVVTALGGDIVFRSKEGKGSVFGFTLPLDQDQSLLENNPKQLGK